uniref:Synaptotagmin-8 n=1 Tax=Rousettus aegyptiacus TaxID=9407 RepID=A0A7J8H749_ROUAE|nr:synaptotagmin 8 [Rousettus aegyptiacus]
MGRPTGPAPAGTAAETGLTPALTAGIPSPRWAVVAVATVATALVASCLLCVLCWCRGRRTPRRQPGDKAAVGLARVRGATPPRPVQPEVDDVESGPGGPQPWGHLQLSLHYDLGSQKIRVGLRQVVGLRAWAPGGTADPCACVRLSPGAGHRHETKVHRGTLCPVFDETCSFQLPGAALLVHVRDSQRFSRHEPLGTLRLPLAAVDPQPILELWLPLGPPGSAEVKPLTRRLRPSPGCRAGGDAQAACRCPQAGGTGELCCSLRYVPGSGRLTVVVLEARGLSPGLAEPLVKVQLMLNQRQWRSRGTSARGPPAAPSFNEAFTFRGPLSQVQSVDLVLAVWARGPRFRAEPVGKVVQGTRASGQPLQHWADMLAHARRPVAQWHRLRPPSEVGQALAREPRPHLPLPGS